jgi:hypothetical protein
MFSLHGGLGRVTGEAVRANIEERRPISQVLERSWLPNICAVVRANIDIARRLIVNLSVAGIEFPGIYYGRSFQVIFWP